ncbi:MAG: pirin family protein [Calditrichaeota bacterium]|nr:MAG: pirin family protein [Calditrichota bacterium]
MKTVVHKAQSRGFADHGWLKAAHSFSFASYYDPTRIHFGKLRVLNDDIIEAGTGFGTHPHDNMEIVTIPLQGKIAHKDSKGHSQVCGPNEVQVMSAGTGIQHSEYNDSSTEALNLLQLWIFPDADGHEPRYDQMSFAPTEKIDKWQLLVSPQKGPDALWLHQDAWLSISEMRAGLTLPYNIHSKTNGVYAFVIDGDVKIAGENLQRRDALGIWECEKFDTQAVTDAHVVLIEIPMR